MRRPLLLTLSLAMVPAAIHAQVAAGGLVRVTNDSARNRIFVRPMDSIGVTYSTVPRNRARIGVVVSLAPSATDRYGAKIESVVPKGPADLAGIRANDIITHVNDVAIGNPAVVGGVSGNSLVADKLFSTLADLQPGKVATLQLRRAENTLTVRLTPDRDESVVTTTITNPRYLEGMPAGALREFLGFRVLDDSVNGTMRITLDSAMKLPMGGIFARTTDGSIASDSAGGRVRNVMNLRLGGGIADTTFALGNGMTGRFLMGGTSAGGGKMIDELRAMADSSKVSGTPMRTMLSERALTLSKQAEEARTRGDVAASGKPLETTVHISTRSSFDALSRLELAPLNKDLGAYFGTNDGVLVLSISPPGVLVINGATVSAEQRVTMTMAAPSAAQGRKTPLTKSDVEAVETELLNLKAGDVVTAVDGRPVSTPTQLIRVLRSYARNDDVKLTVFRQKKSLNINTKMPQ